MIGIMKRIGKCAVAMMLGAVLAGSGLVVAPAVTKGYDMYEDAISQNSLENRIEEVREAEHYVMIDDISDNYLEEIVHSEDRRFYSHKGIDPISIARAAYADIKAGAFVQGGSTITQQLAKNMCFEFTKTYERKIAEVFLAFDLERSLTKDEILELYCNITYFGENCYGIEEAAEHYYGVEAEELTREQAKALAYTVRCPKYYNPNAMMEQ